ncbi:MAG: metalloregulator ArsR/SmtB family transcription factor [Microvirga sp.]
MLDHVFAALSDPTRRAIVARLAETDGLTVGVLAQPFKVSLPAVIKHIDVLCEAGLVTRVRAGRNVACRLSVAPMDEAMAWLDRHVRFWESRLDALGDLVEGETLEPSPSPRDKEVTDVPVPKRAGRRRNPRP